MQVFFNGEKNEKSVRRKEIKQKKQEKIAGHGKQYRLITTAVTKIQNDDQCSNSAVFITGTTTNCKFAFSRLVLQKRMVSCGEKQIED